MHETYSQTAEVEKTGSPTGEMGGSGAREPEAPQPHDPLVDALVFLSHYFGRPQPAVAFVGELPLVDGRLPLDLVDEAASRAELTTKRVAKPLQDITSLDLPAIALQKDGGAAVITSVSKARRPSKRKFEIVSREVEGGTESLTAQDYADHYDDQLILVRPAYGFDDRAPIVDASRPSHWFWSAFSPNRGIYGHAIAATLAINLLSLAVPLFIMNVYDRVIPNNATDTLWALAIGVGIAALFDFILRSVRVYLVEAGGRRADVTLSNRIFQRVLGARRDSHGPSAGAEANVLREYETVREFFTSFTIAAFGDMPFVILFIFIIWLFGAQLALVPAIIVPLVLIISLLSQVPLSRWVKRSFNESSHRNAVLFESLGGIETIKSIGAEGWATGRWERATAEAVRVSTATRIISSFSLNLIIVAQLMATVAIVVLGVGLIQDGTITSGALIASVILSSRALAPLAQIASVLTRLYQARTAFSALKRLMNAPQDRPQGKHYARKLGYDGHVALDKLTFTYPRNNAPILREVSFNIAAGEKVGVIGTIGSGKSTILKLILNLYRPETGSVVVDGFDIAQLDPITLRANIGYAPQGGEVFSGSIRSNITLHAPYVTDDAMVRAAEKVGALEWIKQLPAGFDTPVGERGGLLSSGQRQSVSLARALLLDPPILLLDEPTSEMDGGTEALFLKRMAETLGDKTLLMVTHRTSALRLVDRLIVMDRGSVVADGPKDRVYEALKRLKEGPKVQEPASSARDKPNSQST